MLPPNETIWHFCRQMRCRWTSDTQIIKLALGTIINPKLHSWLPTKTEAMIFLGCVQPQVESGWGIIADTVAFSCPISLAKFFSLDLH
jgi:hypothetical protein